jgi:hypothetical protein
MPFQYIRDDTARRITIAISDPVTPTELIDTLDRQLTEGTWSYATLVDARGLVTAPTPGEMRAFVAHLHTLNVDHGPRGPIAIVARAAGAVAGGQIYTILSDKADRAVEVFWALDDAERWLAEQAPDGERQ